MKKFPALVATVSLAALGCLAPATAYSAEPAAKPDKPEPIGTDRPDLTDSDSVVGKGVFQLESGFLAEYSRISGGHDHSLFTPLLLRWGVAEKWEVRLATDGFSQDRTSVSGGHTLAQGYSPFSLGFKYHFQDGVAGTSKPGLGLIGDFPIPSGSGSFDSSRLNGKLALAAGWDLAPKWSLGTTVGVFSDEDDSGRGFVGGLLTASLERELSSRWASFFETALQAPERRSGGASVIIDGGMTYLVNLDTQLDFAVGGGAAGRTSPDLFWTVGISHRFR